MSKPSQPSRAVPSSSSPQQPDEEGEERCYYFPPYTLSYERDLFEKYHVESFQDLLLTAHHSMWGLVEIMKNIEREADINGSAIFSLGCLLDHVATLIFDIQDAYGSIELLEE